LHQISPVARARQQVRSTRDPKPSRRHPGLRDRALERRPRDRVPTSTPARNRQHPSTG